MPVFSFLSRTSTVSKTSRVRRKSCFQVEALERRDLQSTLTPSALRENVLSEAERFGNLSAAAHAGRIPGYGNYVTKSGQVNDVGSNGQIIESNGSCFDYVSTVLMAAGAHQATNPGPNNFYIWGTTVANIVVADSNPRDTSHPLPASDFAAIQAGEVIQFGDVQLSDGSFYATQHSAIIESVGQTKG